ncbi:MAG: lipid A-modifier LpxR family protein [Myxococcota bacterium]
MHPVLFCLLAASPQAPPAPDAGRISLDLINDAWSTGLDEGFSSRFRIVNRVRPWMGRGFSAWLPQAWEDDLVAEYWSAAALFDIYSPTDLEADRVVDLLDDRPYAGYIAGVLGLDFVFRGSPITGEGFHNLATSLEVGLVGPGTGAGDFQREWHRVLRELLNRNVTPRDPMGWGVYEVPESVLVGLRARYEAEFFRKEWAPKRPDRAIKDGSAPRMLMSGFLDTTLGTRKTSLGLGATFRAGLLPEMVSEGILPISSWSNGGRPRRPFQLYFQAGVGMEMVAFDAFLDGPLGTDGPRVDRRPVNGRLEAGLVLRIGHFELFYRHMVLTREIEDVPPIGVKVQQLGQFILTWAWGKT